MRLLLSKGNSEELRICRRRYGDGDREARWLELQAARLLYTQMLWFPEAGATVKVDFIAEALPDQRS